MGKQLINVDEVEEIVPVLVGKLLENNLITTVGYLAYMDDKSIILGRGIENHCDEDGTRRVKDTIHIPMSLVASFGSFD